MQTPRFAAKTLVGMAAVLALLVAMYILMVPKRPTGHHPNDNLLGQSEADGTTYMATKWLPSITMWKAGSALGTIDILPIQPSGAAPIGAYCLFDVDHDDISTFRAATNEICAVAYESIEGSIERNRQMLILFDPGQLTAEKYYESNFLEVQVGEGLANYRPLVVLFLDRQFATRFYLVCVRGLNEDVVPRIEQATHLRSLVGALGQELPVVVLTDDLARFDLATETGDAALGELQRGGVMKFLQPNYHDTGGWPGVTDVGNSMCNGVFLAGDAKQWQAWCVFLGAYGLGSTGNHEYCHRPVGVGAVLEMGPSKFPRLSGKVRRGASTD